MGFLLGLLTGDKRLDRGIAFDNSRQKRALIHVIEAGRELQGSSQIFDDFDIGRFDQFDQQLLIVEDKIAEAVGFFRVLPFDGWQSCISEAFGIAGCTRGSTL